MTRRRHRAYAAPQSPSPGFQIGVTLTPAAPGQGGGSGTQQISGPVVVLAAVGGGAACGWLVMMRGVNASDVVTWALAWSDQADNPESVQFGVVEENVNQPMTAQIVLAFSGGTEWIDIYAEVNGKVYGPERVQCLI